MFFRYDEHNQYDLFSIYVGEAARQIAFRISSRMVGCKLGAHNKHVMRELIQTHMDYYGECYVVRHANDIDFVVTHSYPMAAKLAETPNAYLVHVCKYRSMLRATVCNSIN